MSYSQRPEVQLLKRRNWPSRQVGKMPQKKNKKEGGGGSVCFHFCGPVFFLFKTVCKNNNPD